MNYLDAFSGYGGFHKAFEEAGWEFDKVYFSEINKYAIANYKYNYPESIYAGSIDTICQSGIIEELDLFTFGWPCQDNSVAGKRQGQRAGTRSGLLYSAVEVIAKYRPGVFVAENVEGLRTVNKGIDIVESLKVLAFLNDSCPQYDIEMQLLNTRWFLPQNRVRLVFVGHLRGSGSRKIFPLTEATEVHSGQPEQNIVSNCLDSSYGKGWLDHGQRTHIICDSGQGRKLEVKDISSPLRANTSAGHGNYIFYGNSQDQKISLEYSQCLSAGHFNVPKVFTTNIITDDLYPSRTRNYNNESPTLTSNLAGRLKLNGIRRLTPIECERLQGLPDNWTSKGNFNGEILPISDSQRYKLCGNGVSIPVIKAVAEKLKSIQQFKEL